MLKEEYLICEPANHSRVGMDYYDLGITNGLEDYIYDEFPEPCETTNSHRLEQIIRPYVHSAICIAGLLGNILVIITYAFYKKANSMTDVYLLNLAVSDVLFVVTLPFIIYNEQYNWSMGTWACKLLRGIYSVNLYSGMLLLACISVDRYIAIVQARRSLGIRSRALVYSRVICIVVWLLALGLSTPTFVYYETYGDTYQYFDFSHNLNLTEINADEDISNNLKVCYFRFERNETAQLMKVLVPSMQVAVGFLVPLVVMGFCYSSIIVTLLRARNLQKHRAMRVVMAVVVVFIACHLPYNISLLYYTAVLFEQSECGKEDTLAIALTITETLAYLHSCLNPVLYAFIGVKFRNHFCNILEDLWCTGKGCHNSQRSSRVKTEFYVARRSIENASSFIM